jgi:O-antigen/teichoic acid export membrane protein
MLIKKAPNTFNQMTKSTNSFLNNSLIRTTGIIFIATFLGNVIAFIANFFLSTKLGPENFGVFKTIIYLFTFLAALANLGAQATIPKFVAEFRTKNRDKIGQLVRWFIIWRPLIILILAIPVILFRYEISMYFLHSTIYSNLIVAGTLISLSLSFGALPFIVQGFQNFRLFSLALFFGYSLPPLVSIFLIPFGLLPMILGFALATLSSYLVTLKFLLKERAFSDKIHFNMKKIIWNFILPMHGLFIVMSLASLTVPLFSIFFDQKIIGYFSYSLMFYTASLLIPNVISSVILPKTSELTTLKKYTTGVRLLKKAFLLYTPIVIFGSIGVLLLSKFFILLLSPEYLPSLPIFISLIILGLFSGYGLIYAAYLQGQGNVKRTAFIILGINILLFLISAVLLNLINM